MARGDVGALIDRFLEWLLRVYEPGAAGVALGLDRCERTQDGYVCRWARARISPERMVQLGHDLQSVVQGGEPQVRLHWGASLTRACEVGQLAELPLENLRKAHLITISAESSTDGVRAEVSLTPMSEPGLAATVRGPAPIAQQVKDAVELGDWNPWSGQKLRALSFSLVAYGILALVILIAPEAAGPVALLMVLTAAGLAGVAGDIGRHTLVSRLWPPVEIYEVEHASLGSFLRNAVPVVAGITGLVATVLKVFDLGG